MCFESSKPLKSEVGTDQQMNKRSGNIQTLVVDGMREQVTTKLTCVGCAPYERFELKAANYTLLVQSARPTISIVSQTIIKRTSGEAPWTAQARRLTNVRRKIETTSDAIETRPLTSSDIVPYDICLLRVKLVLNNLLKVMGFAYVLKKLYECNGTYNLGFYRCPLIRVRY